jgi:hypothetical protein
MIRAILILCLLLPESAISLVAQTPGGYIYDTGHPTLALACADAGSGTLIVSRSWNSLATATYACDIVFTGAGKIQPATGQTLTLTGNVTCPATKQCFDHSAGGSVVPARNQSVYVEWWGAPGNGVASDCPGFLGAVASKARIIYATQSAGYYAPCTISILSGQALQFGPGRHQFNGFIIPDSDSMKTEGNVSFSGQGSALTELRQIAGTNQNFIQSSSFYSQFDTGNVYGVNGFTLKGLTIDGNGSNQTLRTVNIAKVANTTPVAITTTGAHGFSTGQIVSQKNVGGKPEADGTFVITVTGPNAYTLSHTSNIPSNTYTSGGTATNGKGNCIAVYGISYFMDDVTIQNCAQNGMLSGWGIAPADNYTNPMDRTPRLSNIVVNNNGFDGIRWHGPQWFLCNANIFSNGGWGLANDSFPGVGGAHLDFCNIEAYGNTDGAVWNNGSMTGAGLTPSGFETGWGMYVAPNGGGGTIYGLILGGPSIPLEIASVDSVFSGQIGPGAPGQPVIKVVTGYGNDLDFSGAVSTGFVYAVYGESALNRFRAHASLSGGAQLFDPAHPPSKQDIVDLSEYTGANGFWQEHRQLRWNSASVSNPGTVTTTAGSAVVTGIGTAFSENEIGGTLTTGRTSCVIAAVTSRTSLTCTFALAASSNNQPYTISSLPLILTTNTTPIPNLTANWPLYAGGAQLTNNHEVYGVITLNGAHPSSGTGVLAPPFTGPGTYNCVVSLVKSEAVNYSPGWASSSGSAITLNGPNGVTDQWSFRCAGY